MPAKKSTPKPKVELTKTEKPVSAPKNEHNQLWSVLLFAIGVLIFLMTVIEGAGGWNTLHNILLGLFGISVFTVPAILIYTAILIGDEKNQKNVTGRAIWGGALTLLTSSAVQLFFVRDIKGEDFFEKIKNLYSAGKHLKGGGVLSYIIAGPLMLAFDTTGAAIISGIMFFVFLMLLTNMSLKQFFRMLLMPFKLIWRALIHMKTTFSDRDFEDDLDDEDAKDFAKDNEALDMIRQKQPRRKKPLADDFLLDIPISNNQPDTGPPLLEAVREGEELGEFFDEKPFVKPKKTNLAKSAPVTEDAEPPFDVEAEDTAETSLDDLFIRALEKKKLTESHAPKEPVQTLPPPIDTSDFAEKPKQFYAKPSLSLLSQSDTRGNNTEAVTEMHEKAEIIVNTLKSFGVTVRISDVLRGPSITRYEIQPGAGVKVSKIKNLEDDIALYLAAQGVRIEAPVPGKSAVGIEVPNVQKDLVTIREILSSDKFKESRSKLTFAVGKDIAGNIVLGDVAKMPHVIIAGTTGSGKSVCTRSIIMSILYNAMPDEVKIILIDPKIVEFKVFEGIPHLLIPIITEPKKAAGALNWAVIEMIRRYNIFAEDGATDLASYNALAERNDEIEKMPQIVIFIDELADLMLVAGKEVEDSICRLAQMGRAAGMHLVVATQRPTTDVITGLIKANIPSRVALSVMSQVDSRTIIDIAGAEKLLGNGDMLYMPIGTAKPVRIQGCFASSKDVEATVGYIKSQINTEYDNEIIQAVESNIPVSKNDRQQEAIDAATGTDEDYLERAIAMGVENGQLSTSALQRKLKLGYARAARIMDEIEEMGLIAPSEGAKPRKFLMSRAQFEERRARGKFNN